MEGPRNARRRGVTVPRAFAGYIGGFAWHLILGSRIGDHSWASVERCGLGVPGDFQGGNSGSGTPSTVVSPVEASFTAGRPSAAWAGTLSIARQAWPNQFSSQHWGIGACDCHRARHPGPVDYPDAPPSSDCSVRCLLSGGFPSLTAAMAEKMVDAIRNGIAAAKRMVVASSCPVVQRVTMAANTMVVHNAAVASVRVTGRIRRRMLSLVSQVFMAFFRSLLPFGLTGLTAVDGRARDNRRTRRQAGPSSPPCGSSLPALLAALNRPAETGRWSTLLAGTAGPGDRYGPAPVHVDDVNVVGADPPASEFPGSLPPTTIRHDRNRVAGDSHHLIQDVARDGRLSGHRTLGQRPAGGPLGRSPRRGPWRCCTTRFRLDNSGGVSATGSGRMMKVLKPRTLRTAARVW